MQNLKQLYGIMAALAITALTSATLLAASPKDTVLIRLRGADKIKIITKLNAQNVSGLKEIDLNKLISSVDSLLRNGGTAV